MEKLSFQEHIERSLQAVEANKAKGNLHGELLSKMYANPAHFIDELLQNAEDAYLRHKSFQGKRTVSFCMYNDRLELLHDGVPFSEEDLMSITTFANTTKKGQEDVNLIGKFGIGFKSVFAITREPEIHSGKHHYRIVDYEVLEQIKARKADKNSTLFVFPYLQPGSQRAREITETAFNSLGALHLLFLKAIERIDVSYGRKKDGFSLIRTEKQLGKGLKEVTITRKGHEPYQRSFILFSGDARQGQNPVEIALENTDNQYISVTDSWLSVYLPTRQPTGLRFCLNGPFTTSPNRETVPFNEQKAPENIGLLKQVAKLVSKMPGKLKKAGLLDASFFNLLPFAVKPEGLIGEMSLAYDAVKSSLIGALQKETLIPISPKGFALADKVTVAADVGLMKMLGNKGLQLLFGKEAWVSEIFLDSRYEQTKRYLTETLQIPQRSWEDLCLYLELKPEFLKKQPLFWLKQFYVEISRRPHLWDQSSQGRFYSLCTKPFLKLASGAFAVPFDKENMPCVFLSARNNGKIPVVHASLAKEPQMLEFLSALGVNEAGPAQQIVYNILPLLANGSAESDADIALYLKMLKLWQQCDAKGKEYASHYLKKADWVPVIQNGAAGKVKPAMTYFSEKMDADASNHIAGYLVEAVRRKHKTGVLAEVLNMTGAHVDAEAFTMDMQEEWEPLITPDKAEICLLEEKYESDEPVMQGIQPKIQGLINFPEEVFIDKKGQAQSPVNQWGRAYTQRWLQSSLKPGDKLIKDSLPDSFIIQQANGAKIHLFIFTAKPFHNTLNIPGNAMQAMLRLFTEGKGENTTMAVVVKPGLPGTAIKLYHNPIDKWMHNKLEFADIAVKV